MICKKCIDKSNHFKRLRKLEKSEDQQEATMTMKGNYHPELKFKVKHHSAPRGLYPFKKPGSCFFSTEISGYE